MAEPAPPSASAPPHELQARYHEAFHAWLARRDEHELGTAYALGREAVSAQLSVLDLAETHHAATREAMAVETDPVRRAELLEVAAQAVLLRRALRSSRGHRRCAAGYRGRPADRRAGPALPNPG